LTSESVVCYFDLVVGVSNCTQYLRNDCAVLLSK